MKGESTDGNRYIDAAIQKGAVAVVSDSVAENRTQALHGHKSCMDGARWRG